MTSWWMLLIVFICYTGIAIEQGIVFNRIGMSIVWASYACSLIGFYLDMRGI